MMSIELLEMALKTPVVGTNYLTDEDAQRMSTIYTAANNWLKIQQTMNKLVENK